MARLALRYRGDYSTAGTTSETPRIIMYVTYNTAAMQHEARWHNFSVVQWSIQPSSDYSVQISPKVS